MNLANLSAEELEALEETVTEPDNVAAVDPMHQDEREYREEQLKFEADYARKQIAREKVAAARKALRTDLFPLVDLQVILNIPHSDPNPILEKIIYPGAVTLIAGDSKVGKSTFLFHALLAIANGQPHIDLKTRPTRIMYISEQPYQSLRKQLIEVPELARYTGTDLKFIPFDNNVVKKTRTSTVSGNVVSEEVEEFPSTWVEQVNVWQEAVKKWSPQIVILDTYTAFAQLKSGELFDSGPIITKIQQLKSLIINEPELAIVILHHCRKENQQNGEFSSKSFHDMAGSYGFRAATDVNVMITKPYGEQHPTIRKIQIEGRYIENPNGEETIWYERMDGKLVVADDPRGSVYQGILEKILANPGWNDLSIRDLGVKVGFSKSTIERFRKEYPKDSAAFGFKRPLSSSQ